MAYKRKGEHGMSGPPVDDDLLTLVNQGGVLRSEYTATGPDQCGRPTSPKPLAGRKTLRAAKDVCFDKFVARVFDLRMPSSSATAAITITTWTELTDDHRRRPPCASSVRPSLE